MAILVRGGYRFCVMELVPSAGLILTNQFGDSRPVGTTFTQKLLYSVPFNEASDEDHETAFLACQAWIENNDNGTSQYTITEMFFFERSLSGTTQRPAS